MSAVGQKKRPTVAGFGATAVELGHRTRRTPGRGNDVERAVGRRREHDHTVGVPRAAATARGVAYIFDRATGGGDFLHLAGDEEADITAVRRPKRIERVLCAGERLRRNLIE